MPTFTISGVAEGAREWTSGHGTPMRSYRMDLQAPDGQQHLLVEWSRKADSAAPTVGQQVEGTVEQNGQYGLKFKQAQKQGYGLREEDPKRQASIIRQHSQSVALTVLTLKQGLGELTADDLKPANLRKLADWFDDDVRHGIERSRA